MTDLYDLLARYDIEYERHNHPAVFTVEEAQRLVPELPGAKTKNLFLRDGKGRRHFLVVVPAQKREPGVMARAVLASRWSKYGCGKRVLQDA